MLMDRLAISEHRACRAIGQSRTTQRRGSPVPPHEEQAIRSRLRELARVRPRYGYRRLTALLRTEGFAVNHKRIQRICRDEGLRVMRRAKKRSRLANSAVPAERLRAMSPDHVWALDFCFDQTTDIRTLKILSITDEFTREALAISVERSIAADHTVTVLEQIVASTGRSPAYIRMDNGPEMTAHALRDWCRFSRTGTSYIEPGHPFREPVHRIVYRQAARRAARCRGLRHAVGGQDPGRGLPHRLQLTTTPTTDRNHMRAGTGIGVRSAR
jgi:putative transposase